MCKPFDPAVSLPETYARRRVLLHISMLMEHLEQVRVNLLLLHLGVALPPWDSVGITVWGLHGPETHLFFSKQGYSRPSTFKGSQEPPWVTS